MEAILIPDLTLSLSSFWTMTLVEHVLAARAALLLPENYNLWFLRYDWSSPLVCRRSCVSFRQAARAAPMRTPAASWAGSSSSAVRSWLGHLLRSCNTKSAGHDRPAFAS